MRLELLTQMLKQVPSFEQDRITSKGWVIGHCPFAPFVKEHKSARDNSASFCVKANDEGTSGFNCYTCGRKGPLTVMFTYLYEFTKNEHFKKLEIESAQKEFFSGSTREFDEAPRSTVKPRPVSEKLYNGMFPPAWSSLSARTFLKTRGIGEQTCELLGLLFDPSEKRIVFPIRDRDHKLYGFTARTILPKEQWPKFAYGKVKDFGFDEEADGKKGFFLLGAQLVDLTRPLLLVEGLFAEAHMLEIGADELFQPVASMGATLSDYQASIFEDWGKPVYILYDRDGSGSKGMNGFTDARGVFNPGAIHRLWDRVPTYRLPWPKGFYDPDKLSFEQLVTMKKHAQRVAF